MRIVLSDPKLFFKKALVLFLATLILIPLIQYKFMIPALIYVSGLLILHILFFYLYFLKVPWKEIGKNKQGLILRIVSILFLIYILTILKLEGNTFTILLHLTGVLLVHLLILLILMVIKIDFSKIVE